MCGKLMLGITVPVLFSVIHVCALENLAFNKPTWQKHPWSDPKRDFGSENAVDGFYSDRGIKGQCTINADGFYTAEWRVNLGSVVSIKYINIYYRTDNLNPGPYVNRMAGFYLYVSNTTSKDQGSLCYKDQSGGTPSVNQNISCSIYGRYVIYYNERNRNSSLSYLSTYAHNELCEVEVYGYHGSYGDCCMYPCPQNCLNGECDAYTGHCRSCISGYSGQLCTNECPPGYYGNDCRYKCSLNCNVNSTCDKSTGQCIGGCKPGWTGIMCDHACESGYFGKDCKLRCGVNCNTNNCDRFTGQCIGGCKPGWRGFVCDQLCASGYYGKNCSNQCGINCDIIRSCDRVTGECDRGCKQGWTGVTCNQVCKSGYYGKECKQQCSINCNVTTQCNKVTGQCEGGCKPGWTGNTCDHKCLIPYFGKNCSDKCSAFCNVTGGCDRITGRCDGGCKPGWTGNSCDQKIVCNNGYYGSDCRSKCGHCLESKHCHHINGSCLNGCLHGYRGDLCNETCPSGLFGLDCRNRCDTYCTGNKSCDPVMGICNEGCKKGWSGLICGLDSFSNRQPYGDNKPIVIGIVLAVVIVLIGSVINFIYWRRKTEKLENTSQQYTELGKVNKSSNYDELHNYSVFSVE